MTACPECEGVLVCAPGCNGPHAAARADFYQPPPPPRLLDFAPKRRGASFYEEATPSLRAKALEFARANPTMTAGDVARAFNLQPRTVRRWLEGSPPGRAPKKAHEKVWTRPKGRKPGPTALYQLGLRLLQQAPSRSIADVAKELRVSESRLRRWARHTGLRPSPRTVRAGP